MNYFFKKKIEPDEDLNECIICLSPLSSKESIYLNCLHKFHIDCLYEWFKNKSNCPCCRTEQSHARSLLFFIKRKKTHREKFVYLVYKFILKKPYY